MRHAIRPDELYAPVFDDRDDAKNMCWIEYAAFANEIGGSPWPGCNPPTQCRRGGSFDGPPSFIPLAQLPSSPPLKETWAVSRAGRYHPLPLGRGRRRAVDDDLVAGRPAALIGSSGSRSPWAIWRGEVPTHCRVDRRGCSPPWPPGGLMDRHRCNSKGAQ
jgi:hypothetical protein